MINRAVLYAFLVLNAALTMGQTSLTKDLGSTSAFVRQISDLAVSASNKPQFLLPTPYNTYYTGKINVKTRTHGMMKIAGSEKDGDGTFVLFIDDNDQIHGWYTSVQKNEAFKYFTDGFHPHFMVSECDIADILCVKYPPVAITSPREETGGPRPERSVPLFSSNPASPYVIYIDVDGEVSTSNWNGGNTINAAPYPGTNADIKILWEIVSQDYLPFDINVTTDRTAYDAADTNKRIMCIVTTTKTAAPSAAGVAYLGSFKNFQDDPCWAFSDTAASFPNWTAAVISHEIGHTMGLHHDGTLTSGSNSYYAGHNGWGPIMGYGQQILNQWNNGDYPDANQFENDYNVIGSTANGFKFRADDVGNTLTTAKSLTIELDGKVLDSLNRGIINSRTDSDIFTFTTAIPGNIIFQIKPNLYTDLNIKARLLNSLGIPVVTSSPATSFGATITANGMPPGTYYLNIDGVGHGASTADGYSDYGCLGDYFITGSIPKATGVPLANFYIEIYKICDSTLATFVDSSLHGPDIWNWTFTGGTPASSTSPKPTVSYEVSGTYMVKMVAGNSFGTDSVTKTINVTVNFSPPDPIPIGNERCDSGIIQLGAKGSGGNLRWFDAPSNGIFLDTGTTFSPHVNTSTTFYVIEESLPVTQNLGPVDSSIYKGFFTVNTSNTQGLYFDVYSPCVLKSVTVFTLISGNRVIQLKQGSNAMLLISDTIYIPAGTSVLELNYNLSPGTDYSLSNPGPITSLYMNFGGTTYPYTISNLISIFAYMGPGGALFYPYFYNWEVYEPLCQSDPVAVNAAVNPTPARPTITRNTDTLISSSASGNQWYLNGNIISGANGQYYGIQFNGTYTLTVTIAGCTSDTSLAITVDDVEGSLGIFPNPNDGSFRLLSSVPMQNFTIEIIDLSGRIVQQLESVHSPVLKLDLGQGLYLVRLKNGNRTETIKMIVEK